MPNKNLGEHAPFKYSVNIIKELAKRYFQHDISQTGGQLAYFSLLSLFPFIIYINSLITAIHIPIDRLVSMLSPLIPEEINTMISNYVEYISLYSTTKVLSISIIMTLYSASRSVRSLEKAINRAYGIYDKRSFFKSVALSMLFIFLLGFAIIIALVLSIVTKNILINLFYFLGISQQSINFIIFLKWVLVFIALFLTISSVYYFIPNKKMYFRQVIPGTLMSIIFYAILSIGFNIYVYYVLKYSALYGSIGAVFLLMLWLYIAGIILVLGAELNCVLE